MRVKNHVFTIASLLSVQFLKRQNWSDGCIRSLGLTSNVLKIGGDMRGFEGTVYVSAFLMEGTIGAQGRKAASECLLCLNTKSSHEEHFAIGRDKIL
jgi:hypothetical protein